MKRIHFLPLIIALISPVALAQSEQQIAARNLQALLQEKEKAKADGGSTDLVLSLGHGGYLGVFLEEVTPERMKELHLSEERGAIVMKVYEDSPAARAGLKENDVIISYNGQRVESVRQLQRLIMETPPGRQVSLAIIRGGSTQTITVTTGDQGEAIKKSIAKVREQLEKARERLKVIPNLGNFDFSEFSFGRPKIGITVEPLTDQLAEFFKVKGGRGVLVAEVHENTPAARAGLKAGDVIIAIDNQRVDDVDALLNAIRKKDEGQITLQIVRNGHQQSVTLTLEKTRHTAPRRSVRV
jgi:serine protease Do